MEIKIGATEISHNKHHDISKTLKTEFVLLKSIHTTHNKGPLKKRNSIGKKPKSVRLIK
jgi:hypothetical protein